jgi:hypothetical protein
MVAPISVTSRIGAIVGGARTIRNIVVVVLYTGYSHLVVTDGIRSHINNEAIF